MKANRAFRLISSGTGPALLPGAGDRGRVEVVAVEDGEVLLFLELPARLAARLVRELRADLAQCSVEEFRDKWQGADLILEELLGEWQSADMAPGRTNRTSLQE